eukprot:CAMPEP_0175060146 /NCGR_PEP_ID=MMETSP0052_2-20121109/12838_1 /TAXON_ID=51329 ORGANISM="Polytomella parva, Strain SAG 63-3" /NCGR_SAMPLE_ID=MMETSP0052_2 /ASSEMBLY_ACC=CAM_ASM_000194 /LENGTH=296 /DNA_ID=CAMNT_0016325799 /DNA_START=264 /DNA_END=1150 /DNA_ORIENTATION=+
MPPPPPQQAGTTRVLIPTLRIDIKLGKVSVTWAARLQPQDLPPPSEEMLKRHPELRPDYVPPELRMFNLPIFNWGKKKEEAEAEAKQKEENEREGKERNGGGAEGGKNKAGMKGRGSGGASRRGKEADCKDKYANRNNANSSSNSDGAKGTTRDGKATFADADAAAEEKKKEPAPCPTIHRAYGVMGLLRVKNGLLLLLVTKAKRICSFPSAASLHGSSRPSVLKVQEIRVIAHEDIHKDNGDLRYAALLRDATDPIGNASFGSGHLFFSYGTDLSSSIQRQAAFAENPAAFFSPT